MSAVALAARPAPLAPLLPCMEGVRSSDDTSSDGRTGTASVMMSTPNRLQAWPESDPQETSDELRTGFADQSTDTDHTMNRTNGTKDPMHENEKIENNKINHVDTENDNADDDELILEYNENQEVPQELDELTNPARPPLDEPIAWAPLQTQEPKQSNHLAVDLCSGCGGLATAARALGYRHLALVERDPGCISTLSQNGFTALVQKDLVDVDFTKYQEAYLLTAGLPCQPFSVGGKRLGEADPRSLWESALRAIREIDPTIILFEMVAGFMLKEFEFTRKHVLDSIRELGYQVDCHLVDACNHGLPQHRRRCFILAGRGAWSLKSPTLRHGLTVREALASLGAPNGVDRHEIRGAASVYSGHTPSQLDKLAKTVRAGTHGNGGGSNTVTLDDGSVRYFTVRELARLQGFEDVYQFHPVWSRAIKEIGNACPPPMAIDWLSSLECAMKTVELPGESFPAYSIPPPQDEGVTDRPPNEGVVPPPRVEGVTQPPAGAHDVTDDPSVSPDGDVQQLHREARRRLRLVDVLDAQVHVLQGQLRGELQGVPADRDATAALVRTLNAQVDDCTSPRSSTAQLASKVAHTLALRADLLTSTSRCQSTRRVHDATGSSSGVCQSTGWRSRPRTTVTHRPPVGHDMLAIEASASARHSLTQTLELGGVMDRLSHARDQYKETVAHYLSARREAYFHALDAEAVPLPESTSHLPPDRTIFLSVPESMVDTEAEDEIYPPSEEPLETEGEPVVDFFNADVMDLHGSDEEDEMSYQSLRASLRLGDDSGHRSTIDSIVDSGAAWCGIRYATLQAKFPKLAASLQPSKIRFRDASGRLMSMAGKVRMTITLGTRELRTTVHVFRQLGAEFLLGMNALRKHRCVIDCNNKTLYVGGDTDNHVAVRPTTCDQCDLAETNSATSTWTSGVSSGRMCCMVGCTDHRVAEAACYHLICDASARQLVLTSKDGDVCHIPCRSSPPMRKTGRAQLVLDSDVTLKPGQRLVLSPLLIGLPRPDQQIRDHASPQRLRGVHMDPTRTVVKSGLVAQHSVQNALSSRGCFIVTNPEGNEPVILESGTVVAYETADDERTLEKVGRVTIALVLPESDEMPAPVPTTLDTGGYELLSKREFNLDKAIDPEQPLPDGSYAPLSEAKKRILYEIAFRHHQVWSDNPKFPKISLLQVLRVPTGDAPPQAQSAYPIPTKLRRAAMKEIEGLLNHGLIEPSMSDWCSPALVIEKKDSDLDKDGFPTRVKFAIDYRRTNANTQADAGGLGTQNDILYGIGGRYKFIGLCDAAGGFYQYLLDPRDRHKTAFILPAAMGGTLFQWRVAPYGLTRNPAGYSRGMQWTLKGMADLDNLDWSRGKGGASSWLDDICMRATSFEAFADLFERMLARLAMSQISLKGSKCELLRAEMDLLGFVATPKGLMLQKPKLKKLMENGIPSKPIEAREFLGAVAFLRRMIPRIALLTAPMTAAVRSVTARIAKLRPSKTGQRTKAKMEAQLQHARQAKHTAFTPEEQNMVEQSWHSVMDQLDDSAVVASPDFEDRLAHFVLCTDASDFAVGGVLMQWQRDLSGPPTSDEPPPPPKGEDPLDSKWREENGWRLVIIGYYSKTLDPAQKNYPIFDKEAGAILLCVRHWSDLISYHPTTVYTDSSVAASMLTKHAAPPRLQRWGLELGSYLPHLRISFRRGTDNGLADLLSRYPIFAKYVTLPPHREPVYLPDDLFDKIGDAPLFNPAVLKHQERRYLASSAYELYEPRRPGAVVQPIWSSPDAPAIPGRGIKDRSIGIDDDEMPDDSAEAFSAESHVHNIETAEVQDLEAWLCHTAASVDCREDTLVLLAAFGEDSHGCAADLEKGLANPFQAYLKLHAYSCVVYLDLPGNEADSACDFLRAMGCEVVFQDSEDGDVDIRVGVSPFTARHDCRSITLAPDSRDIDKSQVDIGGRTFTATCDFTSQLPAAEPVSGCLAPPLRLAALVGQAVQELIKQRFGVRLSSAAEGCCLVEGVSHGVFPTTPSPAILGVDTPIADPAASPQPDAASAPGPDDGVATHPRVFQWQERGDTPDTDPVPVVDSTVEPTAPIDLAAQLRDPALRFVIDALRGDRRLAKRHMGRLQDNYELKPDALYHHVIKDGEPGLALVVPAYARGSILSRYHFSLGDGAGHSGEQTLYEQVSRDYFWTGMRAECDAFTGACEHCGTTRSQTPIGATAGVPPTPLRPFQVIHVDHKVMSMCQGFTSVLAVVCALTSFTIYIPVKTQTGEESLQVLVDHVFSVFGCPLVIISDNGSAFANKLMKASEALYGFRWIFVMPHTPQANGLAESAVKKLKLIMDRHTNEYQNWVPKVKLAQMAVNQRTSNGRDTPFEGVLGYAPPTLAALENPELLPQSTREQTAVRDTAISLARMRRRLHDDRVLLRETRAALDTHQMPKRRVQPGDKVWLTYSDSERSRYLRKHGHGRAWRHPYVVTAVKPHAVRLDVPTDGSVPEVLAWQSLRKCSFAAPHFHDSEMLLPDVNERGLPLIPESELEDEIASAPPAVVERPLDDADAEYPIERIVSATRVGGGWSLQVKWENYPDTTPEPLWKILKQTNHPDILRDIERCKSDYFLQHPSAKQSALLEFGDVSLVDVASVPCSRSTLSLNALVMHMHHARTFLNTGVDPAMLVAAAAA